MGELPARTDIDEQNLQALQSGPAVAVVGDAPRVVAAGHLAWTLRNSSGVSKGIDKPVVQSGRDFPYIRVGGGQ